MEAGWFQSIMMGSLARVLHWSWWASMVGFGVELGTAWEAGEREEFPALGAFFFKRKAASSAAKVPKEQS
jgi:hypothetical protein